MAEKRYNLILEVLEESVFPPFVKDCIARFEGWGKILPKLTSEEKQTVKIFDYVDLKEEEGDLWKRVQISNIVENKWILADGTSVVFNSRDVTNAGAISDRPITRESMKDTEVGDLVMIHREDSWQKALVKEIIVGQLCLQWPHYMNIQPKIGDVTNSEWVHADDKTQVKRWMHEGKKIINKAGEVVGTMAGATNKVWNNLDEQFHLEDKLKKAAENAEKGFSWAEKHFTTMFNKLPKKRQQQIVRFFPAVEAGVDVANNTYQMTKAYQALNASIAEKGVEATMAELSSAATTGAMYVGGAVVIAGAAYGSYKLAEKHYPEETQHVKMKAKDEMEYTVLGGVDLGKVFMKSVGKRWKQTKGEKHKVAKERPLNKNNITLLKSAKLLKATTDFTTRCTPPEVVEKGTILTVYQFSEEDCMVLVDCASFSTVQWLSISEIYKCVLVDPDQVGSELQLDVDDVDIDEENGFVRREPGVKFIRQVSVSMGGEIAADSDDEAVIDDNTFKFKENSVEPWGAAIGFRKDMAQWKVTRISDSGQFFRLGVRKGWRVVKVDDYELIPPHKDKILQILRWGKACTIKFEAPLLSGPAPFSEELVKNMGKFLKDFPNLKEFLGNFIDAKQQDSHIDETNQNMLVHGIYCLYQRKVFKVEKMPSKKDTAEIRAALVPLLEEHYQLVCTLDAFVRAVGLVIHSDYPHLPH